MMANDRSALVRRALICITILFAALAPTVGPANAGHPANTCLDLTQTTSSETLGSPHTLTAVLKANGATLCDGAATTPGQNLVVNFEISGPSDPDAGDTPGTPDRSCTILAAETSCATSYTGTNPGTDTVRAWIATHSVDLNEGVNEGTTPGEAEPDATDVETVQWTGGTVPATLDCDDAAGPDTERETNPISGAGSTETYTCVVRDANGVLVTGTNVTVKGENETNLNDPPSGVDDGAGYASPDYSCTTGATGTCQINVAPTDGEVGTTTICFYTGDGTLCGTEAIDETEANDLADRVEITWANRAASAVEAEPETDTDLLGVNHVITARVFDQFGAAFVGNTKVDLEFFNGSPTDADGNTPATPDRTCTTSNASDCTITYTQTNTIGTDLMCVFRSGANPSMNGNNNSGSCAGDGLAEGGDANNTFEAPEPGDDRDVIQKTWQELTGGTVPATIDCDDPTGPDTEHETNPRSGTGSNEVYSCTVRDSNGALVTGTNVTVKAEVEGAVNDPPSNVDDGAGYATPDYSCLTGSTGRCQIDILPTDDDVGTTTICFYTGDGTLCSSEAIDETEANDLADRVELTWANRAVSTLEAEPETDLNGLGENHQVTVRFFDQFGAPFVGNTRANLEFFQSSPTDTDGNTPNSADRNCTTSNSSDCTITYTQSTTTGVDLMCLYLHNTTPNMSGNNTNGTCSGDGLNETGDTNVNFEAPETGDDQDVVQKTWQPLVLTMTPASDTASVGVCNPFTIALLSPNGTGISGVTIDVEQMHARASDGTANNEPTVSFCTPPSGPNPSAVDTTKGDLNENPNNVGTLGGETSATTDTAGQVTIGISVAAGQGSDGTGQVTVTAFRETSDNDDPNTGEPQDSSTKTWVLGGARTIDCEPENATRTAGETYSGSCVVRDRFGDPVPGVSVTFSESGTGDLTSALQATTDAMGTVLFSAASVQAGAQTITGTITNDLTGSEPGEVDECDRGAGDPSGAPQGICSDSVAVTWNAPPSPQCSDGLDNDGDGDIDYPLDDGCSAGTDATEDSDGDDRPEICKSPGAIVGNNSPNTLTGTDGPDIICGLGGDDVLVGLDGDDVLLGNAGNDLMDAGEGIDIARGGGGDDVTSGGDGSDLLTGGRDDDTLRGNSGPDSVIGGRGDDTVRGGKGNDTARGGRGSDAVFGGRGSDSVNGGSGFDLCRSGPGSDLLRNCET